VQSIADLTKVLKEKNGKATYASPNNATVAATELYSEMVGAKAVRVNFKAVTAAIADVAAGEIDFTFADIALAVPQSRAGRVRVLAVTTPERASVDKSFPTMAEAGVPGYEYTSFFGMWAPAGTPQPIVDKLGGWMQKIIGDKEIQEAIVRSGFDPLPGTAKDLTQLVTEDSKRWAELVKTGKLEAN
jgi:tripartite-type tricarboxylate transporter receptor subunit TctC